MARSRARQNRAGPFGLPRDSPSWLAVFTPGVAARFCLQPARFFEHLYRAPPAPIIPNGEVAQVARDLGATALPATHAYAHSDTRAIARAHAHVCVCVCACVCLCLSVRGCVPACIRACVRACNTVRECVREDV